MGIPDHLNCLWRNLYAGQESTVRTGHGATDWFQIWKGIRQDCKLSPCLFNLYAEYIMWNAELDEAQARIKIAGRNINNLRYSDDTTLVAESKEELKILLMRWKNWFKTQHSKNDHGICSHHFLANRQGNSGNTDRFYFLRLQNHCGWLAAAMKLKDTSPLKEKLWQTEIAIKNHRHHFADQGPYSKGYGLFQ